MMLLLTPWMLAAVVILPSRLEVGEGRLNAADLIGDADIGLGDLERMKGVDLGRAPKAGKTRRIAGRYLRRLLGAAGVVEVRVPTAVVVTGRADTISAEAQLAAIRATLERRLGKVGSITSVRPFQNLDAFAVPPGSVIGRAVPVGAYPFQRRVSFRLEIRRRGQQITVRYPQVLVEGHARVLVMARSVRRGARLGAGDLRYEERPLDELRPAALHRLVGEGKIARRGLRAGTVLQPSDLKAAPVVLRGQQVRIMVRDAVVSISTRGEALGSGAVGEFVAVRNLASGRRLRGRVVAPGQVEIAP
jgi:flagella basal body P-ring formation protein FlgA